MVYGYIRVSTREQNEARQVDAMRAFGVDGVYMDKQSGKDFNRPQYKTMIEGLNKGDVVVVLSLDRFGRNYDEIQDQWRLITKDKEADIVVLNMDLLDTRVKRGNGLTGKLISDIVLQLLAYVAQTEREYIHQRQAEGIAAKRARGEWDDYGRPRKEIARMQEYVDMVKRNEITVTSACKELGISKFTWYKRIKEAT